MRVWQDKSRSIKTNSLITVVKTGEHGRPFRLETLDGALIMQRVLAPGTAVIMTLEANLKTKHGVPAVEEAGSSGSIVFRSITDRVAWGTLTWRRCSRSSTPTRSATTNRAKEA